MTAYLEEPAKDRGWHLYNYKQPAPCHPPYLERMWSDWLIGTECLLRRANFILNVHQKLSGSSQNVDSIHSLCAEKQELSLLQETEIYLDFLWQVGELSGDIIC